MNVTRLIYKPIVKWAAYRAIAGRNRDRLNPAKGRFTRAEVDRLLQQAWRGLDELAPNAPREPTKGSRMMVTLARFTVSLFRALMAAGVERDYAIELISDVTWKVYEKWGSLRRFLARKRPPDLTRRVRNDGTVALTFPFNPPGYIARWVPTDDGIGYDMLRCPVAGYFRAQGAADLCVASWCNLDYALAEMWGGKLVRTKTLVAGDDRCDFRFKMSVESGALGLSKG